jgi:pimeloyl-ACP methyl ester carboxylesterase
MFGLDRSGWMPFARHIATLGYTALAIDFPGAGTSTGRFSFTLVNFDTVAVIDYLTELGYERIVCMGASMGAGACFEAAILRPELAGLVIIAAPVETTVEESAGLLMPKLFLVGKEPDVKMDMEEAQRVRDDQQPFTRHRFTAYRCR